MTHKTYHWKTNDNKILFAQCWKPDKVSKNTILLIHGLGEHSGRYARWAEMFVENGYNFFCFDLRGHGKSSGKKGHARSLDILLDDIDLAIKKVKKIVTDSKLILYGHSMGGNLVLNHIIRRNYPVDALIVTSPWLKLTKEPHLIVIASSAFISKIFPFLTLPNGISPEYISHDPEVVRNYQDDPLNHNKISVRLFQEMYHSGYYALRNVYKINYPFLLMHGTEDQITSPKSSESYVMNTCSRTQLRLWEGQYHELHNELIYKDVFNHIIGWLKQYDLSRSDNRNNQF